MLRLTEKESNYQDLDKMSVGELLTNMNREDKTVPAAVEKAIPQLEKLVEAVVERTPRNVRQPSASRRIG